jgi:hypothetical protein
MRRVRLSRPTCISISHELFLVVYDEKNVVKKVGESLTESEVLFIQVLKLNLIFIDPFHPIFKLIYQLF